VEVRLLKTAEVAKYLRVSQATVLRWCASGKLPAFKIGREWRIPKSELDRLARSGQLPLPEEEEEEKGEKFEPQ